MMKTAVKLGLLKGSSEMGACEVFVPTSEKRTACPFFDEYVVPYDTRGRSFSARLSEKYPGKKHRKRRSRSVARKSSDAEDIKKTLFPGVVDIISRKAKMTRALANTVLRRPLFNVSEMKALKGYYCFENKASTDILSQVIGAVVSRYDDELNDAVAEEMMSLQDLFSDVHNLEDITALLEAIKGMEEGDRVLVTVCCNRHTMRLLIEKTEREGCSCILFNTGYGVEYNEISGADRHPTFYQKDEVPIESLYDEGKWEALRMLHTAKEIKSVYEVLEDITEGGVAATACPKEMIQQRQEKATCTVSSLFAVIHYCIVMKFGKEEYKKIKWLLDVVSYDILTTGERVDDLALSFATEHLRKYLYYNHIRSYAGENTVYLRALRAFHDMGYSDPSKYECDDTVAGRITMMGHLVRDIARRRLCAIPITAGEYGYRREGGAFTVVEDVFNYYLGEREKSKGIIMAILAEEAKKKNEKMMEYKKYDDETMECLESAILKVMRRASYVDVGDFLVGVMADNERKKISFINKSILRILVKHRCREVIEALITAASEKEWGHLPVAFSVMKGYLRKGRWKDLAFLGLNVGVHDIEACETLGPEEKKKMLEYIS
jgi:hypothetical protein